MHPDLLAQMATDTTRDRLARSTARHRILRDLDERPARRQRLAPALAADPSVLAGAPSRRRFALVGTSPSSAPPGRTAAGSLDTARAILASGETEIVAALLHENAHLRSDLERSVQDLRDAVAAVVDAEDKDTPLN